MSAAARHPVISVVICTYDYERYVSQAIDSALAQDHSSFEVIVVDDGSTDGTPEVLAGYGDAIRAVRRPNGGLNAATDTGVAAAAGDYITFLDADDTWPQGRLRALAGVLDARPEVGLVYGDMEVVDDAGAVLAPSFRAAASLDVVSVRPLGRLLRGNVISAGSLMVRAALRPLFQPIAPVAPYQDWWIATRVAAHAEIAAIDAVVNRYRHHGGNMNLGSEQDKRHGLLRAELAFRQLMLTGTDASLVDLGELVTALRMFHGLIDALLEVGTPDVLDAFATDRPAALEAVSAASGSLDEGDLDGAAVHLVRAAAHDPSYPDARALLSELLPLVAGQAALAA